MKYLLAILVLVLLGGCSVDDAIARAERATDAATAARSVVVAAIEHAEQVAAGLKTLAVSLDSERAKQIGAQADALVAAARSALPQADAALAMAKESVAVAKKAKEDGGGWLNVLLSVAGVLVPGGGIAAVMARNVINGLKDSVDLHQRAVVAATEHADRMETAMTDPEVAQAKLVSVAQQKALGVADLIDALRSGTDKLR